MADLPLDALPGETALGPDGRRYRLNYDDHWHVHTDERRPGNRPIARAPADDPERRAAERKRDTAVRAALLAEEAA